MSEKAFWEAIRSALLAMVAAIERRYGLGKHGPAKAVEPTPTDTYSIG